MAKEIHIIGAGLAGSEAAWQIANLGGKVVLHEMRPQRKTDAHHTDSFAELVCSNSFRSDDKDFNAVGLIHEEMRQLNSIILQCADGNKVPAGGALAVDRHEFSASVTKALEAHPNISIVREEFVGDIPKEWDDVIIASGPLTSDALSKSIAKLTDEDELAFFDAIAPIVYKDSINFDKAWYQSRYDKIGPDGDGKDYINCPMSEVQYHEFIDALIAADSTEFKEWEGTPYFDGCLPIEIMAERGRETLRWGPMKPVGLTDPKNPTVKPYAIVQLRQDNKLGTLYNIVGFQTKLKYGSQADVLRMIPGLDKAEFARLGGIHRNTYLNSPILLDKNLSLKKHPKIRFAGQITGVEGYVESAACGLLAGRFVFAEANGGAASYPPETTALGALLDHITGGHLVHEDEELDIQKADEAPKKKKKRSFQPMNVNFGLFPPVTLPKVDEDGNRIKGKAKSRYRKQMMSKRALIDLKIWIKTL
ncbi:MAG: methylenetetrahydrofolate--tRNA-(uracil(54)-C(5))-methyltransferase (FADH(2)-oxidizing) TrmFO [Rhizobiales bacterium]|nr:methylenetetrahydrofolate--tRNA-(uracil(54)-C(5))-methyltransferase (FADH(2)-oxidizing) TrmFO [Hyphomicrobiales bacterium]NRB14831.1 methylenetetrahydrofolate--tRNA-(uracil(54)-C(5))-methyltransferase (FADH(2)-oxidizing) TrmFO [Hyphomicrobiales bacterium]